MSQEVAEVKGDFLPHGVQERAQEPFSCVLKPQKSLLCNKATASHHLKRLISTTVGGQLTCKDGLDIFLNSFPLCAEKHQKVTRQILTILLHHFHDIWWMFADCGVATVCCDLENGVA